MSTHLLERNIQAASLGELIRGVRSKGVRLWSEQGRLRYRGPKGALTAEDLERLSAAKSEILRYLDEHPDPGEGEPALLAREKTDRVPLTYSQLSHWQAQSLENRPSVRQLATALQLRAALDVSLLQRCLAKVGQRHEALRVTICADNHVAVHRVAESASVQFRTRDLSALSPEVQQVEIRQAIDALIMEPIHVSQGPLTGVDVLVLGEHDHVLIIVMEHIISDAFSLNILLRDLLETYFAATQCRAANLPELPVDFLDYAHWQFEARPFWARSHGPYWKERLSGCSRLCFPRGEAPTPLNRAGWATVPIRFSHDLKQELLDWCRVQRTTLVMSVFSAFAAAVLRWCGSSDAVLRYQTDGRTNPKIENAIGFFAAVLHLRIQLLRGDTFVEFIRRATAEYCAAYEHMDFCRIDAQQPKPEFCANSAFNWVSAAPNLVPEGNSEALAISPIPFVHPLLKTYDRDCEPSVLLYDTPEGIVGGLNYPAQRFARDDIQRFADKFMEFIAVMVREPHRTIDEIHQVPIPADVS